MAKGFEGDDAIPVGDGDGGGGEGAGGNCVFQNGKGGREEFVLSAKSWNESRSVIQGFCTLCGFVICAGYSRVARTGKACELANLSAKRSLARKIFNHRGHGG